MANDPIEVILDRMSEVGMGRADLVRSSGLGRESIDRYLERAVVPTVTAWLTMLDVVGLDLDTNVSAQWAVAERAERSARRAQLLEMHSAERPTAAATLDLFLASRAGNE